MGGLGYVAAGAAGALATALWIWGAAPASYGECMAERAAEVPSREAYAAVHLGCRELFPKQ